MRLKGKVAIVTASAGAGIGQAAVRGLAAEGANVVVSDMHEGRTNGLAAEIKSDTGLESLGVVCDISQQDQVANLTDKTPENFGRIDILVPYS